MNLLGRLRSRQRFYLMYAACMCAGAGGVAVIRPGPVWAALAMLCAGLGAAWLVGTVACHHVHKRLHSLREAADACVRGDLSTVIDRPPDDDFFKLSDSVERILNQLKETCQEEDRLRRQLTRSEKLALIGELAATVAHEVNNPLDGLQNSTRIIRRNLDHPEQVRQLLDLMDSGLYRIEMIMRRLLTMSRDEPVCPLPTRMDEIVDDALMFAQPKLTRYGIELVRDFPDAPVFGNADRVQMAQVLINLMINATDAMRSGGKLTIRCRMGNHGQSVLLDVIDTGTGIAPEHLPHIFEPFYSTKGKGGGTGLGLTVVRRIIEAHRGTVEVESQVNQGTRFRIILPAAVQSLSVPEVRPLMADLARSWADDSQTSRVQ